MKKRLEQIVQVKVLTCVGNFGENIYLVTISFPMNHSGSPYLCCLIVANEKIRVV